MKITELRAYKRLEEMFEKKGYSRGIKDDMPIYCWDDIHCIPNDLTPGHYVYANRYGKIKFKDIPEEYRTREFFLHTLSGAHEDIVEYVKAHPEKFDKKFFKDHIETNNYGLKYVLNDFEYMPLEFIDEEMVICAMFRSVNMRYRDKRGDCENWFYSVYRRKPEVLTQDLYTLGARCFAAKRHGVNKFLDITPKEYRTSEFYFALCLNNDTPVMEDIPESVLTTNFLVSLLDDNIKNIQSFSEAALERETEMIGRGTVKFWQAAIIEDGYQIQNIHLNDERVEFFLAMYDKDSFEYECAFKEHYKKYLREENSTSEPKNRISKLVEITALAGTFFWRNSDSAINMITDIMKGTINRQSMLPINYDNEVPVDYYRKYDKEEYLLEVYKKIGVQVLQEADHYYYKVTLPENISIVRDECGYSVNDSKGETLLHYCDRGAFYDRTVTVDKINVTL